MKESDLYPPVKAFLESQGYTVKGEIGPADVMALRGDEPPVIVELKTALNLTLILQGVARQTLFADVYLAVPQPPKWTHRYRDLTALLRRLGLGLLTIRNGAVEAHLDPGPYQPRHSAPRAGRLLREFQRRAGDPNVGGTTGIQRMTAYRQDALRLAALLQTAPASPAALVKPTGIANARAILSDDHYGWFERVSRGVYALTPKGRTALDLAGQTPPPFPFAPPPLSHGLETKEGSA
jgi:hypothetical protein